MYLAILKFNFFFCYFFFWFVDFFFVFQLFIFQVVFFFFYFGFEWTWYSVSPNGFVFCIIEECTPTLWHKVPSSPLYWLGKAVYVFHWWIEPPASSGPSTESALSLSLNNRDYRLPNRCRVDIRLPNASSFIQLLYFVLSYTVVDHRCYQILFEFELNNYTNCILVKSIFFFFL